MKRFGAVILVLAFSSFILMGIALAKDRLISEKGDKLSPARCGKTMNIKEAADKVKTIVNKYFTPNKDAILSGEPIEESGLYKVNLSSNNSVASFYITKDAEVRCTLLR